MLAYLEPKTGVIVKAKEAPEESWSTIPGVGSLYRTRTGEGQWIGERVHYRRSLGRSAEGWEEVYDQCVPLPGEVMTGPRSGIRFGFAELTEQERSSIGSYPSTAVVLPDEPGILSAANCPGSRYHFQLVMLVGGAPSDYLIQKLLTHRIRKIGLDLNSSCWLSSMEDLSAPLPENILVPEEHQARAMRELQTLATLLSDDLAEEATERFGEEQAGTAWSRRRQWQLRKVTR